MVSDARGGWQPAAFPSDAEASGRVREWLADDGYSLFGVEHDFRGADLSGGDFTGAWLMDAVLSGVRLAGAGLYRADLRSADLTGADLTGADLVSAHLDEAVLRSARLDGADMVKASPHGVDASGASFRGTRIMGASFLGVDLRGADLTDAVLFKNAFEVPVDDTTVVRGLTGTAFGPITVMNGASSRELAGPDLHAWIAERGGRVEVIPLTPL